MPRYLGLDTSNYTTSVALYDSGTGEVVHKKKPLPVAPGEIGLRQSDAVFSHVKQLGALMEELMCEPVPVDAVGVSARPRDVEGSYMPCFLVGEMVARSTAAVLGVPCHCFSHQAGHLAAALYGSDALDLLEREFLAFHLSGGTTECLHVAPDPDIPFRVTILSQSNDLFAGQLVDRVGAMLSLPFPSGPALEELAQDIPVKGVKPTFRDGDPCLSGLENQCRKLFEEGESSNRVAAFLFASLGRIVEEMCRDALEQHPGLPVVFSGGVMSNGILRQNLQKCFGDAVPLHFAPPVFSADNAAGIAILAGHLHRKGAAACRS